MNILIFDGRLAKDAERHETPTKKEVWTFSAAMENRSKTKKTVTWVTCEWYIDSAKNKVPSMLKKGTRVFVQGPCWLDQWVNRKGEARSGLRQLVREISIVFPKRVEGAEHEHDSGDSSEQVPSSPQP